MTILTTIIATCTLSLSLLAGAKAYKAHLNRTNPSVEAEAELEAILVHCIAVEFSKRGQ